VGWRGKNKIFCWNLTVSLKTGQSADLEHYMARMVVASSKSRSSEDFEASVLDE
jgi:hypothetical protein